MLDAKIDDQFGSVNETKPLFRLISTGMRRFHLVRDQRVPSARLILLAAIRLYADETSPDEAATFVRSRT